jgi:hypothetical protein
MRTFRQFDVLGEVDLGGLRTWGPMRIALNEPTIANALTALA